MSRRSKLVASFCSLACITALQGMEQAQSLWSLDKLPPELVCLIASNLFERRSNAQTCALEEGANHLVQLAGTCKTLYNQLTNSNLTNVLLYTIGKKLSRSPLEVAAVLKLRSAQQWAQEHLARSDDYRLFRTVKRIQCISQEVWKTAQQLSIVPPRKATLQPPSDKPSENGQLILCVGNYPHQLITPWGLLKLYNEKFFSFWDAVATNCLFFEYITASFIDIEPEDEKMFYQLIVKHPSEIISKATSNGQKLKHITLGELRKLKSKNPCFASRHGAHEAWYEITHVEDQALVTPTSLISTVSPEVAAFSWKQMELVYNQEKSHAISP